MESGTRVVKSASGLLTAAEEFPVAELEETAVPELEAAAELEPATLELESAILLELEETAVPELETTAELVPATLELENGILLELEETVVELDGALELEESSFALVESSEQAAKAASAMGRMYFVIFIDVKLF